MPFRLKARCPEAAFRHGGWNWLRGRHCRVDGATSGPAAGERIVVTLFMADGLTCLTGDRRADVTLRSLALRNEVVSPIDRSLIRCGASLPGAQLVWAHLACLAAGGLPATLPTDRDGSRAQGLIALPRRHVPQSRRAAAGGHRATAPTGRHEHYREGPVATRLDHRRQEHRLCHRCSTPAPGSLVDCLLEAGVKPGRGKPATAGPSHLGAGGR